MSIRQAQLMLVTAIPVLVGTFGFISLNRADAEAPIHQIAQTPLPPNPSDSNQLPPQPDFAAAAAKLGVSKGQLKEALSVPPNPSDTN